MARKSQVTQDDVVTWAMSVSGMQNTVIAKALGCHGNTVAARLKKIGNWIAEKFDINEYRMPLYALYPEMIKSVMANLAKNDVTMTLGVMRGLQILVDKTETARPLADYSDHELRQRIREASGYIDSEPSESDRSTERVGEAS